MKALTPEQRQEVERNIGLVHYFANRYRVNESEREDLIQECCLSLMEAIQSDARSRVPLSVITKMRSKGAFQRLRRSRRPMTWLPKGEQRPTVLSLGTPLGEDDGATIGDVLPDPGSSVEDIVAAREELSHLAPRNDVERRVLALRAEGMDYSDIGHSINATGAWASMLIGYMTGQRKRPKHHAQ